MSAALVLENVHKSFGEHEVLKGMDLAVGEHEVVCLIGASGSGKSTLLRCVNLLEPIDEGETFNFTVYVCAAVLFVAITIPLTRFTDHLVARDRARRQASGALA